MPLPSHDDIRAMRIEIASVLQSDLSRFISLPKDEDKGFFAFVLILVFVFRSCPCLLFLCPFACTNPDPDPDLDPDLDPNS